jgi:hypothetical protein
MMFGKSREELWWDTFNAAMASFLSKVEWTLIKQDDGSFGFEPHYDQERIHELSTGMANRAHGVLR